MCSSKLKSFIIGPNGQQLAILGLSKFVALLIKRVFHLSFKKTKYYRLYDMLIIGI